MKRSKDLERARKRLEARRGFLVHLTVFVAVITTLVVINIATAPAYLWAKWPLMGWGIGVMIHGLMVFVVGDRLVVTDEMVEREAAEEEFREKTHA